MCAAHLTLWHRSKHNKATSWWRNQQQAENQKQSMHWWNPEHLSVQIGSELLHRVGIWFEQETGAQRSAQEFGLKSVPLWTRLIGRLKTTKLSTPNAVLFITLGFMCELECTRKLFKQNPRMVELSQWHEQNTRLKNDYHLRNRHSRFVLVAFRFTCWWLNTRNLSS